jgi:hypothetical protein
MDSHLRALGWAYILYGALSAFVSVVVLLSFGGLVNAWVWAQASGGLGPVFVAFLLVHVLLGLPMVIGGVFLLRLEEWARLMMVVVSALNVLNLPLGSILGGYGLWVLLTPETEPLFVDPIFKSRTGRPGRQSQMSLTDSTGNQTVGGIPPAVKAARTNLPE